MKQEEGSDELASLKISGFRKNDESKKNALSKLTNCIAIITPLAIPTDRTDIARKRFLRSEVCGIDWSLHADKGDKKQETYQSLVDTLFASIRVVQKHKAKRGQTDTQPGVLYLGQKRYGIHLASTRTQQSSVRAALTPHNLNLNPMGDRCFNCSLPRCSVKTCKKPRESAHVRCNLDAWKRYHRINASSIHLTDIDLEPDELREAFIALLVLESDDVAENFLSDIAQEQQQEGTQPSPKNNSKKEHSHRSMYYGLMTQTFLKEMGMMKMKQASFFVTQWNHIRK